MTRTPRPVELASGRRDISRGVLFLGLAASTLLFLTLELRYWSWTSDDAYITFRYAENLAKGLGAVFNAGERVEGYSNFLWMIVLAAAFKAGLNTVLSAKVIGILFSIATLGLTAGLTTHLTGGRLTIASVAAPLLVATSFSFVGWSAAGLETSLFVCLVTATVWRFSVEREAPHLFPWSGVLAALTGLTRPEGVVIFAVLCSVALYDTYRGDSRRRILALVAAFAVIAVPYMIWRLAYFGYLLPNTFYVKGGRGPMQIVAGVLYVTTGISKHGGMLLHVLALVAAFVGLYRRRAVPAVGVLVVWQIYNVYKGTDVLELFRFFVPILPILFALSMTAVVTIYDALRTDIRWRPLPAMALGVFLLGTIGTNAVYTYLSRDYRLQLKEFQVQIRIDGREFAEYADRLKSIAPRDASIAVVDAGALSYFTGWYTLDRWGLCDEYIAHLAPRGPNGEKFDAGYILSKRPTFIQTKVMNGMEERETSVVPWWPGDVELFAHPDFASTYVRLDDPALEGFYVRREALSKLTLNRNE